MKRSKQQTGTFPVFERTPERTIGRGTFRGTIFWGKIYGKVTEAVGVWEDSPLTAPLIRNLLVDEKASENGKIYCLFY